MFFEDTCLKKSVLKDGYLSHGCLVVNAEKDLTFQIRYAEFIYFE